MANELNKPNKADDAGGEKEFGAMPTKTAVKNLSSTVGLLDQKMSKLRGEKGAAIKTAANDENVHKWAFAIAMKLRAMEPDERANAQRHLAKYQIDLGIELQGDLLKDAPAKGSKAAGGPGK